MPIGTNAVTVKCGIKQVQNVAKWDSLMPTGMKTKPGREELGKYGKYGKTTDRSN